MNTGQRIFTKLFKDENTELNTHKINLSISQDYENAVKKYSKEYSRLFDQVDEAFIQIRTIERAIKEAKSYTSSLSKIAQDLRKLDDDIIIENDKVLKKIKEAEKSLGIEISINKVIDPNIRSSENSTRKLAEGMSEDINGFIKYVNKLELPKI